VAWTEPHDQAGLLSRYRLVHEQARVLANLALEGVDLNRPRPNAAPPSPTDLRGIPCVARGSPGAIRYTQPEAEVVRRLTRRE
jgi:hypothetical protein